MIELEPDQVTIFDSFFRAVARESHGDHVLTGGVDIRHVPAVVSPAPVPTPVGYSRTADFYIIKCDLCGASTTLPRSVGFEDAYVLKASVELFRQSFPPSCEETRKFLQVQAVMES